MVKSCSIAVAVVIYNESCANSQTCCALERMTELNFPVLIYDNSTVDTGNKQYCEDHGWVFLGGTGNVGLSKAYNACIHHIRSVNCAEILCLFDDDTDLDAGYFQLLMEALQHGGDIFVPLVYANGSLISPCLVDKGHIARRFADEDEALKYAGGQLSAINSGMALDLSLFDHYHYDENIFLDGIDHQFLMDMKKKGKNICVFPYRCNHAFSGEEKPALESAKKRFEIFSKDYRYILRNNKWAYIVLVGKRALKLAVQYRTFSFLRYMLP